MTSFGILISEHAVNRFMERVRNKPEKRYDFSGKENKWARRRIKREMVNKHTAALIHTLGNGEYPVCGSCVLVVKDKTVITIIRSNNAPKT